jgi:hypothetical protein
MDFPSAKSRNVSSLRYFCDFNSNIRHYSPLYFRFFICYDSGMSLIAYNLLICGEVC